MAYEWPKILKENPKSIIEDYQVAYLSRLISLKGRREVLAGRAKFGIFGDGKELPQIVLARYIQKGDWRSGYYRDQTLLLALKELTARQFFAQLYSDTDIIREPSSGGRQMNCHFGSRFFDSDGFFLSQTKGFNISSDISPTAGQMARLLGLAYASKLYRHQKSLTKSDFIKNFSQNGDEVAFGTIGNASTAEGLFWESMNAAGVLQVPLLMSVWDDAYGISVPNSLQMTKGFISDLFEGFAASSDQKGFGVYKVKGHDYFALHSIYAKAVYSCRRDHRPCLVHVYDITQPQGHSTSGSHERYKSKERLDHEEQMDGLRSFERLLLSEKILNEKSLLDLQKQIDREVEDAQHSAWSDYQDAIKSEHQNLITLYLNLKNSHHDFLFLEDEIKSLSAQSVLFKKNLDQSMTKALLKLRHTSFSLKAPLVNFYEDFLLKRKKEYSDHLYYIEKNQPSFASASYSDKSLKVDGRQVIQAFFDKKIKEDPRIFIIGEDVGRLGGVNLEFEGLQDTHGDYAITDTGIREATILGQGIGCAMRGLRPIVDIQYLDYLLYCLQGLSDDLATLHYRSAGGQIAPVIVRTKGHRLEGIWHTGSPIGMIASSVRGMYLCVPRNCVQAVGMYQTLLKGFNPAIVIEVLNGYRLKEMLPDNLNDFSIPLGVCETLRTGHHMTLVTYGACCFVALEAAKRLSEMGIEIEVIDVQTLLPFDSDQNIFRSLSKTNALAVLDEDVSGASSGYLLDQILVKQKGYEQLDAPPVVICSKDHRAAYGSDGDYFSKPNVEKVVLDVYSHMAERFPKEFPLIF